LLKGDRIFTLQLKSSDYVIGKIEKGFDFTSTANNRRLGLQSPTLSNYTSRHLLRELIRLGYLAGHNFEFIGVAKRYLAQDSAEITVASEATKQYLLQTPILISSERITIKIPATEPAANPQGSDALTTTILVRGLPIEFSQAQITVALHRLLGIKNVLIVTFSRAQDDLLGRHDWIAQIRCLNAAVYTHWCERKVVPLLGRQVDFSPHIKSLSGSSTPVAAARAQSDSHPTRQIIADAITAFKNETAASSTLSPHY
jgi:hypothetical protein